MVKFNAYVSKFFIVIALTSSAYSCDDKLTSLDAKSSYYAKLFSQFNVFDETVGDDTVKPCTSRSPQAYPQSFVPDSAGNPQNRSSFQLLFNPH